MRKAFFISDLHLGAKYFESPLQHEKKVVRFLDAIKNEAGEIYLLGDILDYWYEYKYVVPRGFVRFFGKLAELADAGIKITWLIGNHDIWIFDYLPAELGISVIDGPLITSIAGKKFYLEHGDRIEGNSFSYRLIRATFRNKICQKLYAAIHPRWTIPFATAWSKSSRCKDMDPVRSEPSSARLEQFCNQYLSNNQHIDWFIFGHLHIIRDITVADNSHLVILGDWIDKFSYASFDGQSLLINYYE